MVGLCEEAIAAEFCGDLFMAGELFAVVECDCLDNFIFKQIQYFIGDLVGLDATEGTLPPPKWRNQATKQRISTQKLIQQLRSEVWSYALEQIKADSNGFVAQTEANTKCQELQLPLFSTVLYASTG